MRHVAVRRAALILATVFVLFAGLFAWTTTRDDSEENGSIAVEETRRAAAEPGGAALYDAYCARCHPVETLRTPLSQERYRELQEFLRKHGKSSDDEDRLILDYLAGR
jgi:cytochrome c5